MGDVTEQQTRALLDSSLALRRGPLAKAVTTFHLALVRCEELASPGVVRCEVAMDGTLTAIELANGPEALKDTYEYLFGLQNPDRTPTPKFPCLRIEYTTISQANPRELEIFKEARAPHPRDGLVPCFYCRTLGGVVRMANKAEKKLLLRIALVLQQLATSTSEAFVAAFHAAPPLVWTIRGSSLHPKVEIGSTETPPWWTFFDRADLAFRDDASLKLPVREGTWRVDLMNVPIDHGHSGTGPGIDLGLSMFVLGDPVEPRIVGALPLAIVTPPTLATAFFKLVRELATKGTFDALPAAIECDESVPTELLSKLFARDELTIRKRPRDERYERFLKAQDEPIAALCAETALEIQLRDPQEAFEWFECMMAAIELQQRHADTFDDAKFSQFSLAFCGDAALLSEDDEDNDDLTTAASLWYLAFSSGDDAEWFPKATPNDPTRAAGFHAFVRALRAAKSSFFRISRIVDRENVECVDVLTGRTYSVYSFVHAEPDFVNCVVAGRMVSLGSTSLLLAFAPPIVPGFSHHLLRDLESLGLVLTATHVENDRNLGQIWSWFLDLDDAPSITDEWEGISDDIEGDPRDAVTERMIDDLSGPLPALRGQTLAAAKNTEIDRAKVAMILRSHPSAVFEDSELVEPDRDRAARALGVEPPASRS